MNAFSIIFIIVIILIVSLIAYMVSIYNELIKLETKIQNDYSNIDVDLKKRNDLIPQLVEIVKGYMSHEQDLLVKLVESRNGIIESKNKEELNKADNEVSSLLKNIFALAENYPDLKASTNFLQLQEELRQVEESLTTSRKKYNSSILNYNNAYLMFPTRIFAFILGFKKQEYFKIEELEKEMPKISFE